MVITQWMTDLQVFSSKWTEPWLNAPSQLWIIRTTSSLTISVRMLEEAVIQPWNPSLTRRERCESRGKVGTKTATDQLMKMFYLPCYLTNLVNVIKPKVGRALSMLAKVPPWHLVLKLQPFATLSMKGLTFQSGRAVETLTCLKIKGGRLAHLFKWLLVTVDIAHSRFQTTVLERPR